MTEEGRNAVKEFAANKEKENNINRNLIELNNYFKKKLKQVIIFISLTDIIENTYATLKE